MKHKLKLVFKLIIRIFYTLKRSKKLSFNDSKADYIIWVPHFYTLRFLVNDNFQKTLGLYTALLNNNKHATLYTQKNIGKFYHKNIIYYGSEKYNVYSFSDYTDILSHVSSNLEKQNNKVFPSSYEVSLWENKSIMHDVFEEKSIRTPMSKIIELSSINKNIIENFDYPALIKEEHSCSSMGIYRVNSSKEVYKILESKNILKDNNKIILQQLLKMRKDLRVIIVGNEIVLHYWRINLSSEWKPTATGQGSRVDFKEFPEQWKDWILDTFRKLDIKTGAFDIAWQNDDINTEPYILEISPFYQPNPIPFSKQNLDNYGQWKKSVSFRRDGYQRLTIDTIFNIQKKFSNEI